jgi:hypothetical protein
MITCAVVMLISPRMLLFIVVFCAGFTASSAFDLPSNQPISAVHLSALIFVASHFVQSSLRGGLVVSRDGDKSAFLLILFTFVVSLTIFMPALIDGKISISSNVFADLYEEPLYFSSKTLGRPMPLFFGVVLTMAMISALSSEQTIKVAVKTFLMSGAFIASWGLFQFACFYILNIEYPDYIFNNTKIETARGFAQNLGVEGVRVMRLSSVTHEPSVLAKFLLLVVSILLSTTLFKTPIFSRAKDTFALVTCILVILLSTSNIGYFGLAVCFAISALLIKRYRNISAKLTGWAFIFIALLLTSALIFDASRKVIYFMLVSKFESYSAAERLNSVITSWEYFLEYPLLGVGWGVVTVNDLVVNLLVNSGVLGLVSFTCLAIYLISRTLGSLDLYHRTGSTHLDLLRSVTVGLMVAFVVSLVTGLITGIEFYLAYFYVLMALLIASSACLRRGAYECRDWATPPKR